MKKAGYSTVPLAKKLGIKSLSKIKIINGPAYYLTLFSDFPDDVKEVVRGKQKVAAGERGGVQDHRAAGAGLGKAGPGPRQARPEPPRRGNHTDGLRALRGPRGNFINQPD